MKHCICSFPCHHSWFLAQALSKAERERKKMLKCLLAALLYAFSHLCEEKDYNGLPLLLSVLPLLGVSGKHVLLLRKNLLFSKIYATIIPHGSVGFRAFRLLSLSG